LISPSAPPEESHKDVAEVEVPQERIAVPTTTAGAAADVGAGGGDSGGVRDCCRERERRRRALTAERDALRDALKASNEVRSMAESVG